MDPHQNNLQLRIFLKKLYDHWKNPEYINHPYLFQSNVGYLIYCINFTKTYELYDIDYYNDGTKLTGLVYPSTVSVTSENGTLRITTSTSGEKTVFYPLSLTNSDNFSYEVETVTGGTNQNIGLVVKTGSTANGVWFAYSNSTSKWEGGMGGSSFSNTSIGFTGGMKVKIVREDGTTSIYVDNTLIKSTSHTLTGTFQVGHYTNSGRVQYVDNIKIKRL